MNIGIDASYLNPELTGGMQEYLKYVIKNLALLDSENTYVIYFKRAVSEEYFKKLTLNKPNFKYKYLKTFLSWEQVSLPFELFKNSIDILFCNWHTIPGIYPRKLKIVSVIHDLDFSTRYMLAPYYTCKKSDLLIAVSEYTKASIIKKFRVSENKIKVIYEGVDLEKFKQAPLDNINQILSAYSINKPYIFFLGTLGPRKNIPNMLHAFERYLKKNPKSDVIFVLAGRCMNGYEKIYEIPSNLGISERVKFLGKIANEDVAPLYSGALSFLFVSYSEGFGLPVLEAMACGCPVITSTIGSLKEIAGGFAIHVNPNNVDDITMSIENVLDNKDVRQKMIKGGLDNVLKYTWSNASEQILNCLENFV